MMNSVSIADSRPQSTPISPPIVRTIATGTVRVWVPVSSSANRNSFQVRMTANTKVAARPA